MQILDNFLIIALHILCFISGLKLANYYNAKQEAEVKDALERQFLRLRAHSDADDPCRPYGRQVFYQPVPLSPQPRVDEDGDNLQPITQDFMDQLKQTGQAKTTFRKSDLKNPA